MRDSPAFLPRRLRTPDTTSALLERTSAAPYGAPQVLEHRSHRADGQTRLGPVRCGSPFEVKDDSHSKSSRIMRAPQASPAGSPRRAPCARRPACTSLLSRATGGQGAPGSCGCPAALVGVAKVCLSVAGFASAASWHTRRKTFAMVCRAMGRSAVKPGKSRGRAPPRPPCRRGAPRAARRRA